MHSNLQCGFHMPWDGFFNFTCYDPSDNMIKWCENHYYGYYRCWDDGSNWEHANWHENDMSMDYSNLTSVETDGIFETSPSIDVR